MKCKYLFICNDVATRFVGTTGINPQFEGALACCEKHFKSLYVQDLLNLGEATIITEEDYLVAEVMFE